MSVVVYKCPSCGAAISFDADAQKWLCQFCGSAFDKDVKPESVDGKENTENTEEIENPACPEWETAPEHLSAEQEESYREQEEFFEQEIDTYICPDCGAKLMTGQTTAATFCAFCHNPMIIQNRLSGVYKPKKVLPFKIGREKAISIFKKKLKKRFLVPKVFRTDAQIEEINGIYVPFWLFDCEAWGGFHAKGMQVHSYRSGQYHVTVTNHYNIVREGSAAFYHVPADASKKMDNTMMDCLEPYQYEDMQDFDMSYLSGFLAEMYDESDKDVLPRIDAKVEEAMQNMLRDTVKGFSSVVPLHKSHTLTKKQSSYALLPVWMLSCRYKEKNYIYAINGQTGRVVGDLPVDVLKGILCSLAVSIGTFLLCLAGGLLWA
ncbi:MAG: hypothetical protein HFE78_05280 [Clostridiales bacterium]|nr:hypothetical protein [Clostridiales bacterium]